MMVHDPYPHKYRTARLVHKHCPLTCSDQTHVAKCTVRARPLSAVRCRSALKRALCSALMLVHHCTPPAAAVMTAVSCSRQLASVMGGTSPM
jgi:hypothetical protein